MKDGIAKGTGNSRYLKTVKNAQSLYPTYDAFIKAFVAGSLPVDLNGINPAGWELVGTTLNKETLLQDITAENLALTPAEDATPAQVLEALRSVAARDTGNILINSDFRNPINSRGQTKYTREGFVIDGWFTAKLSGMATSGAFTIENDGVRLDGGGTSSDCYFRQKVVGRESMVGQTVTLSFLVDAINGEWAIGQYGDASVQRMSVPGLVKKTFTFSDNSYGAIMLWNINAPKGTIKLRAAKLELGTKQTLAHRDENGTWVLNDPPPNGTLEALKAATRTTDSADTYSGMSVSCTKLVWENASPDSDFAAQTIPLSLNPDDMVMIIPGGTGHPTLKKVGQTGSLAGDFIPIDGGYMAYVPIQRSCTVSEAGIQIGDGTYGGSSVFNHLSKPMYVYVVKGVS